MSEPFGASDALPRGQPNLEPQSIWQADRKKGLCITHSIPETVFLSDRMCVFTQNRDAKVALYSEWGVNTVMKDRAPAR